MDEATCRPLVTHSLSRGTGRGRGPLAASESNDQIIHVVKRSSRQRATKDPAMGALPASRQALSRPAGLGCPRDTNRHQQSRCHARDPAAGSSEKQRALACGGLDITRGSRQHCRLAKLTRRGASGLGLSVPPGGAATACPCGWPSSRDSAGCHCADGFPVCNSLQRATTADRHPWTQLSMRGGGWLPPSKAGLGGVWPLPAGQ